MSSQPNEIHLKNYTRPHFWIKSIDLDFDIFEKTTFVVSTLTIERNTEFSEVHDLVLDGVELKLHSIELNGNALAEDSYIVEAEKLTVKTTESKFTLTTKVEIDPENNKSCEGFFRSGDILCTQNEAEGFRKITYYLDRPDVMASFKTTVRGDKKTYPFLLSNGNKIDSGELENGRHFATWEDPHLKPAYLFAVVAGDLALVKDTYTTTSGREVSLEFYVDHGNEDKCEHAIVSLQNSMKWDEDKFGLEYDLDIYMVVAVDYFNMGAMENKGLNIFNSAYVLAKRETATDHDFQGVEGVIGHEYFHNWTGNRVTCRDWFQLTLKEGLTVFRDQEFSADMLSRPVKRIDDVSGLRSHQFPEDAGPMSHPIKPKSYIEINNFYSSTVYEKGSEVIRMIHTLLGADGFRKGMDLYFKRHDGQAVTTEDFVSAMSDATGIDLEQFKVWYDQNGTPKLKVETSYSADSKTFVINVEQESKLNNDNYSALHMPFFFSLYNEKGELLKIEKDGNFELKDKKTTITLSGIESKPVASLNRGFSAPVLVEYEYSQDELMHLMSFDKDEFNRFDACQKLYFLTIQNLIADSKAGAVLKLSDKFMTAFKTLLSDDALDSAFLAYALSLPGELTVNNKMKAYDVENVSKAISFMKKKLGSELETLFLNKFNSLEQKEFSLSASAMGERALRNVCLSFLYAGDSSKYAALVNDIYSKATNMTDEIGALALLAKEENEFRDSALASFYAKWKNETLVMQKWFAIQAAASDVTIDKLQALEKSDVYDAKAPNVIRSVSGRFGGGNVSVFNKADGSGYKYLADKILELDKFNPQLAARYAKIFGHKQRLDNDRAGIIDSELTRLSKMNLSKDTFEVVSRNLSSN